MVVWIEEELRLCSLLPAVLRRCKFLYRYVLLGVSGMFSVAIFKG